VRYRQHLQELGDHRTRIATASDRSRVLGRGLFAPVAGDQQPRDESMQTRVRGMETQRVVQRSNRARIAIAQQLLGEHRIPEIVQGMLRDVIEHDVSRRLCAELRVAFFERFGCLGGQCDSAGEDREDMDRARDA
jgi:hypothetical protein